MKAGIAALIIVTVAANDEEKRCKVTGVRQSFNRMLVGKVGYIDSNTVRTCSGCGGWGFGPCVYVTFDDGASSLFCESNLDCSISSSDDSEVENSSKDEGRPWHEMFGQKFRDLNDTTKVVLLMISLPLLICSCVSLRAACCPSAKQRRRRQQGPPLSLYHPRSSHDSDSFSSNVPDGGGAGVAGRASRVSSSSSRSNNSSRADTTLRPSAPPAPPPARPSNTEGGDDSFGRCSQHSSISVGENHENVPVAYPVRESEEFATSAVPLAQAVLVVEQAVPVDPGAGGDVSRARYHPPVGGRDSGGV